LNGGAGFVATPKRPQGLGRRQQDLSLQGTLSVTQSCTVERIKRRLRRGPCRFGIAAHRRSSTTRGRGTGRIEI
jgi:hypothetical protein